MDTSGTSGLIEWLLLVLFEWWNAIGPWIFDTRQICSLLLKKTNWFTRVKCSRYNCDYWIKIRRSNYHSYNNCVSALSYSPNRITCSTIFDTFTHSRQTIVIESRSNNLKFKRFWTIRFQFNDRSHPDCINIDPAPKRFAGIRKKSR